MPLGRRWKSYSVPSTTTVCPALLPPWKNIKILVRRSTQKLISSSLTSHSLCKPFWGRNIYKQNSTKFTWICRYTSVQLCFTSFMNFSKPYGLDSKCFPSLYGCLKHHRLFHPFMNPPGRKIIALNVILNLDYWVVLLCKMFRVSPPCLNTVLSSNQSNA